MRSVVIDAPGQIRIDHRPDPVLPGPDGAIVAVTATAICGSDLHFYEGDYPLLEPVALGHEAIGTVVEVGPDVRHVTVGDLVLVSSVAGCGHCVGDCRSALRTDAAGVFARRSRCHDHHGLCSQSRPGLCGRPPDGTLSGVGTPHAGSDGLRAGANGRGFPCSRERHFGCEAIEVR